MVGLFGVTRRKINLASSEQSIYLSIEMATKLNMDDVEQITSIAI